MKNLSGDVVEFFYWWTIKAPTKLFKVLKRILTHVNYASAFTLNIRLLFTPFFGDYTFIGRIIGFVFRVMWIISGSIGVVLVGFITLVAPLVWYIVPFFLIYYIKLWFIPFAIIIFISREFLPDDPPIF